MHTNAGNYEVLSEKYQSNASLVQSGKENQIVDCWKVSRRIANTGAMVKRGEFRGCDATVLVQVLKRNFHIKNKYINKTLFTNDL